jgi:hypothetical protein
MLQRQRLKTKTDKVIKDKDTLKTVIKDKDIEALEDKDKDTQRQRQ